MDMGHTSLRAMCSTGLEASIIVDLAEAAGIAGEDSRVGFFEGSWIVCAGGQDDPGLKGFKELKAKFTEKERCWKAELSYDTESSLPWYYVTEIEDGEVREFEENYDDTNSFLQKNERAGWWKAQEEAVDKWYTFEEFKEIPEDLLF